MKLEYSDSVDKTFVICDKYANAYEMNGVIIMVYVRLLGTVAIEQEGQSLRKLGSQKSIAMLTYLISRKQAVSRIHLADLFWSDKSESTGRKNVRWSLNNLSNLLPDCFLSERETIQFEPTTEVSVDMLMFDMLRNKGDFDSLALALEHYQGDFMDGFFLDDCADFERWVLQERSARRQQVIQVMERLIAYYAQFNQFFHVFQLISDVLNIEPWREDMHRQMMYCLVLKGKRSAALKHFEVCCELLEIELQVAPELETRQLYEDIRDGKDISSYNQFSESVNSVIVSNIIRKRLPIQITPFIGRSTELEHLSKLILGECRLLTLIGQGGIGKTRLAIELAKQLTTEFKERVYFVPLASVAKPAGIPLAIAESVGYKITHGVDIVGQLVSYYATEQCLLVLDNFEHLVDGSALLDTLLTQVPNLYMLISSRIRTNLTAEYVYEVQELAYPHEDTPPYQDLASVTLFMSHMNGIMPEYPLSKEDHVVVKKICELTRGVPLALELAASWLNSLALIDIATELQDSIEFLTHNRPGVPIHHRSIRATFEHTWDLLSESEQTTVAKLAIFKGGCTRNAAHYITETNLHTVSSLIDKSILRHDSQNGRYTMHELYRQFVTEKLNTLYDVKMLQQRHTQYYLNMLHQYHDALYSNQWCYLK